MNRHRHSRLRLQRNMRGAGVIVLVFILAVLVVGVLGVFSYEWTRVNTARQELQHVCEASALAAAAAYPNPFNLMDPHNCVTDDRPFIINPVAEQAAQQIFISNCVLQAWLTETQFSDSRTSSVDQAYHSNPAANEACMYFEVEYRDGSVEPWNSWNPPKGQPTQVRVIGSFGELPTFGAYCGIGKVVVHGDYTAQIPWIHTWHSDWFWQGSDNADWTDNGAWQVGWLNYTANPQPVVVNDILTIAENPGGLLSLTGAPPFTQRYGYFQVVGKFDSHSWAKMWLADSKQEAVMPQIDVVDSYGGNPTEYHGIVHQNVSGGDVANAPNAINGGANLSADFHSYGVMWLPGKPNIDFMLDGKVVAKVPKFANTDSIPLEPVIGNSPDTVFGTSTGNEPAAQYLAIDAWEMNPEYNSTNVP